MQRIATLTAEADLHGTDKDGFSDGIAPATQAPTVIDQAWCNAVQEEPANVIERIGASPLVAGRYTQMCEALSLRAAVDALLSDGTDISALVTSPMVDSAWVDHANTNKSYAFGCGGAFVYNNDYAGAPGKWVATATGGGTSMLCAFTLGQIRVCAGSPGAIRYRDVSSGSWSSGTPAAGYAGDFVAGAYGASIGVLIGTGANAIQTSTDGNTWTSRTIGGTPTANSLRDVTFGNGVFVVVGLHSTGWAWTSPDGITWTARAEPVGSYSCKSVCYSQKAGLFFALALTPSTYGFAVYQSADGITWTDFTQSAPYVYGAASAIDNFHISEFDAGVIVTVCNVASGVASVYVCGASRALYSNFSSNMHGHRVVSEWAGIANRRVRVLGIANPSSGTRPKVNTLISGNRQVSWLGA